MSRRPNLCKSDSQRIHARRRAKERYGLSVDRDLYYGLVSMIKTGQAIHVIKTSCSRSVFLIHHKVHGKLLVTYDKKHGNINTFLPRELIGEVEKNWDDVTALLALFRSNRDLED